MRNAIITGSSKTSDIVGVLTGVWNEYDERGWHRQPGRPASLRPSM